VKIPDTWSAQPDSTWSPDPAATHRPWWTSFGSAELDSLITEALRRNNELAVIAANVDAARAAVTIAGADRLPQIGGNAQGSRRKQNFIGLPIPGAEGEVLSNYVTTVSLSVETTWELDLWNRIGRRKAAAVADLQATEADLEAARLSLAGLISKTFIQITEVQVQLELAQRTEAAYRQTEDIALDRYRRGLISAFDVYLTRTQREQASALAALRRNQLQQTSRQLELLLSRYPAGKLKGADVLPPPPGSVPAGLPAELIARRPDLLAAERRLIASRARISESRRAMLPQVRLTGSLGQTATELTDILDGDFSVWSIAGALIQPLFQGGRLRAQVDLNEARGEAELRLYVQSVLDAFGDVERALTAEGLLAEREGYLVDAVEAAESAWRLSETRYRQGVGTLLAVLEAQRRALEAESTLIAVRSERLLNRVDLHLALGGGFESPMAAQSTSETASARASRVEDPTDVAWRR
jgi:NodT family efflux transporter outer membrane factor (OMF) lipoprotein